MKKKNRSGRLRRLAFALALVGSGCSQVVLLVGAVGANSFATAFPFQNKTASSKDRTSNNARQSEAKSSARVRGAEPATTVVHYDSPDGPIIRIALMTDVTSVTLSCASGLTINHTSGRFEQGKRLSNGSVRVELSQHSAQPLPVETAAEAYRVIVRYSYESRVARHLADELKKKFFEPVTVTYDENQNEYAVLIGQCPTRGEASRLAERLRKAGYEGLRIVSDPLTGETRGADSTTGPNTRTATYKGQPASNPARRIQLVALAGDRIAASSGDQLIIIPDETSATANLIKQKALSPGADEKGKLRKEVQSGRNTRELDDEQPAGVRVGSRDYRGEMHVVLNARGLINVVNVLPLEQYLRGVVLMEIPMGSVREIEALKAQAVAARTYALSHLGNHQDRGYDLVNDARAQSYGGLTSERALTNRATEETSGVVAVYPNDAGRLVPIEALYTANCGGRTENNEEVFGGKARGYLRSVACVPDRQPLAGRDIVTNRTSEPLIGPEGHVITREVAMLSVLGFSIPRRVTNNYLQGAPDRDSKTTSRATGRIAIAIGCALKIIVRYPARNRKPEHRKHRDFTRDHMTLRSNERFGCSICNDIASRQRLPVGYAGYRAQISPGLSPKNLFVVLGAASTVGRVQRFDRHKPSGVVGVYRNDSTGLRGCSIGQRAFRSKPTIRLRSGIVHEVVSPILMVPQMRQSISARGDGLSL